MIELFSEILNRLGIYSEAKAAVSTDTAADSVYAPECVQSECASAEMKLSLKSGSAPRASSARAS